MDLTKIVGIISASETSNKNPRLTTTGKDKKRFLIIFHYPFFGFAFSSHILLIESCISANTAVGPNNKTITPMTAASVPLPLTEAFLMIVCNCAAASSPTNCRIW